MGLLSFLRSQLELRWGPIRGACIPALAAGSSRVGFLSPSDRRIRQSSGPPIVRGTIGMSGAWYFQAQSHPRNPELSVSAPSDTQMPPGYGSSEEDDIVAALQYSDLEDATLSGSPPSVFRFVPNEELLAPLIEAFARACLQITSLKVASLSTTITVPLELESRRTYTPSEWGIWFAAPGASFHWQLQQDPAFRDDTEQRRLIFDTKRWQPDGHICNMLRDIGRERYGTELVEKHVDYWDTITKPKLLERYREVTG